MVSADCLYATTHRLLGTRVRQKHYLPTEYEPSLTHQKSGKRLLSDRKNRQAVEVFDPQPVAFPGLRKYQTAQTEHAEIVGILLGEDVVEEASEPVSIHFLVGDLQVAKRLFDANDLPGT